MIYRTIPLLAALAAVTSLPLLAQKTEDTPAAKPATDGPPPGKEESAEVTKFRTEMGNIKAWLTGERYAEKDAEARAHAIPVRLAAKLANVETKGLPADVTAAFKKLSEHVNKHAALLKGIPEEPAAVMEWMMTKLEDEKFTKAADALNEAQPDLERALVAAATPIGAAAEADLFDISGGEDGASGEVSEADQIVDRWVVILGVYKKFPEAKKDAEAIAKKSGVPFTMNGMIYDKDGLHLPKDHEDELYAGQYVLRRFNATIIGEKEVENHISIEMSSDYEGFAPGYYMIVGKIAETAEDGAAQLAAFKKSAPDTYVKKTKIFIGCDR